MQNDSTHGFLASSIQRCTVGHANGHFEEKRLWDGHQSQESNTTMKDQIQKLSSEDGYPAQYPNSAIKCQIRKTSLGDEHEHQSQESREYPAGFFLHTREHPKIASTADVQRIDRTCEHRTNSHGRSQEESRSTTFLDLNRINDICACPESSTTTVGFPMSSLVHNLGITLLPNALSLASSSSGERLAAGAGTDSCYHANFCRAVFQVIRLQYCSAVCYSVCLTLPPCACIFLKFLNLVVDEV